MVFLYSKNNSKKEKKKDRDILQSVSRKPLLCVINNGSRVRDGLYGDSEQDGIERAASEKLIRYRKAWWTLHCHDFRTALSITTISLSVFFFFCNISYSAAATIVGNFCAKALLYPTHGDFAADGLFQAFLSSAACFNSLYIDPIADIKMLQLWETRWLE